MCPHRLFCISPLWTAEVVANEVLSQDINIYVVYREFLLTKVFSAFVLVDVYVDLFDSLQSLGELGPVRVALWRGSQKLHQQKRVTHHSLNGLD